MATEIDLLLSELEKSIEDKRNVDIQEVKRIAEEAYNRIRLNYSGSAIQSTLLAKISVLHFPELQYLAGKAQGAIDMITIFGVPVRQIPSESVTVKTNLPPMQSVNHPISEAMLADKPTESDQQLVAQDEVPHFGGDVSVNDIMSYKPTKNSIPDEF